MSHVLVKFVGDYADEFSVYGFQVFTEERWNETVKQLKTIFETHPEVGQEVYFGTNEFMTWENVTEFFRDITVTKISALEADVLNKLFGGGEFGHTFIEQMLEYVDEYDEED